MDLTKIIETQSFTFDDAFDASETNEMMYSRTISPLVAFLFDGGKASCFAYGQTGSGTCVHLILFFVFLSMRFLCLCVCVFCVFEYAFFVFLRVSFCESMQFDGLEYVLPLPYGTI